MSSAVYRVLILCTANSARSQMAEGIMRHLAPDGLEVESAGTAATTVRPEAVEVLREIGIDITSHRSKHVESMRAKRFDCLITVCDNAREACPVLPGIRQQVHWSLPDPAAVVGDQPRLDAFRAVRDTLTRQIEAFLRDRCTDTS